MTQGWLFSEDEMFDTQSVQTAEKEPELCDITPEKKPSRRKEKSECLFTKEEMSQPPLNAEEKDRLIRRIIRNAQLGARYMYRAKEVCAMLRITYDEIQTLLNYYRLDCVVIRDTIIRIPWWSLAEYLIDPADDVETAMYEYLNSLPHGSLKTKQSA